MLGRMFGLFGLIMASGYLIEGLTFTVRLFRALPDRDPRTLIYYLATMSVDLVVALVLVIGAVGLLFAQRWAQKMWLITMSILSLMHLLLAVFYHLGQGVSTFYLVWTWMVIIVTAMSWWYFTRQTISNVPQPENLNASPEE